MHFHYGLAESKCIRKSEQGNKKKKILAKFFNFTNDRILIKKVLPYSQHCM